jgi:NAD(P)H-dependent FMN reductase
VVGGTDAAGAVPALVRRDELAAPAPRGDAEAAEEVQRWEQKVANRDVFFFGWHLVIEKGY